ncbi:MAG: glucose-1-phosphate cytidylyltransferase [Alphaproteobacteria bacterium]|nr:glucose-1-phosphate cytidylyltransferase [Alphaproteobacteria bacterium]MBT4082927.1 glucose-1-phosphate cytidylyltransferase [Alphaproteobacteria bacterium]MBT4546629.1 glucose-1-phosphate cytidylyltransferase [Alphaproteobacteria bacterium]MBT7747061.1 glucose-1-phosphate cytidylyltransferase [Alphaproteobacteria bacterium]
MKAVILAGGFGTRFSEETLHRPKPMIEIGGQPIIWHIMKGLAHYGIKEFIICLGYKGYSLKEYFLNYLSHKSDVTVDLGNNSSTFHQQDTEDWVVSLIDTGAASMTGGRLRRVRHLLGDEDFLFTYGDSVSDVNVDRLVSFHREKGGEATMTAVHPHGRFGHIQVSGGRATSFDEKPDSIGGWVNGGYFILNPSVIDLIKDEDVAWEAGPLRQLAESGKLHAYEHQGFWACMDTQRDHRHLEELWSGDAPWKIWN